MNTKFYLSFLLVFLILLVGCSCNNRIIREPMAKGGDNQDIGVYAYLINHTDMELFIADEWYAIEGLYNNVPIGAFYVNTSIPAIVYNGAFPVYLEVQQHMSISSLVLGSSIHIAVSKNGNIIDEHRMGTFMGRRNEPFTISQNEVLYVENGDYIQLVIESDSVNNDITLHHHTTSIRRFY